MKSIIALCFLISAQALSQNSWIPVHSVNDYGLRDLIMLRDSTIYISSITSIYRADADFSDARLLDLLDMRFQHLLAGIDDYGVCHRINNISCRSPSENAHAERYDDFAGIDDRPGGDRVARAAILLADDGVLRHVNQAARQIA